MGSIPVSGRFPGVESGNPLRYSFLESPWKRGACCAQRSNGVTKLNTTEHTYEAGPRAEEF